MKLYNLFLILSFILLLSINIFGQAAVDIPLSATDGTFTYQLAVGLDLIATNGIDEQLGEYTLPGPPPGVFGIAFDLSPYTGEWDWTFKDYRPPGNPPTFPFTGMIEHTLLWTWTSTLIDIMYNLPYGTQMVITDVINGSFLNLGPFTGQGTATIPSTYTQWMNKAFLKMQYDNIVPIELISFNASVLQNEKAIQLRWKTATETNNSEFEILRFAQNDNEWSAIGFVPGFGTTTETKTYSFFDEDVSTGLYKYRLKQIDFDGSFEYSNEIEVEVDFAPEEFILYQNYPNPFNPSTIIKYEIPSRTEYYSVPQFVTLKVYDILGNEVANLVNEEKPPGVNEVEFDGTELTTGIYFYQLQVGDFIQTRKMTITK
jgi:hypothetical protein